MALRAPVFLAVAFLAVAFLAVALRAPVFLAVAFFAEAFLAEALRAPVFLVAFEADFFVAFFVAMGWLLVSGLSGVAQFKTTSREQPGD